MKKIIPNYLVKKSNVIKMLLFVTVFSLLFINIYTPFKYVEWFKTNSKAEQFLFSTVTVIGGALILSLSRLLLCFVHKRHKLSIFKYIIWIGAEMLVIALAYTVFNKLFFNDLRDFSAILSRAALFVPLILFIPYLVVHLYFELKDQDVIIRKLLAGRSLKQNMDNEQLEDAKDIVHFKDEKGTLRLLVKQSNLYYIESADNYVNIYYSNKNKITRFMLRNSLKNIEEAVSEYALIRCHRSYIVNIDKVKVLRREKDGLFIDLGVEEINDIPVSKTYADKIMELFQTAD
ncbi:MAG TPA: response regulator transcription factor [Bacteroidales bacterium]|nr:response regulator transcription factor [Bacteroidales bacterium]HPY80904.1 LytTR family DNA-binding domain-containing protein [Bacteroidales bacterium]HQA86105.1 LytTR family DNA-binding domain-containing protein [Bacteroidales bacterium]